MAAAAHDVGRAEHDEITAPSRLACSFLVDGKFGDADALSTKCLSHRRALIVVREHPHIGGTRYSRQSRNRCRNVISARNDALHQVNAWLERPVRSTIRLRFCGLARLAMVESMWSLNANRSMRPSDNHWPISLLASRLY